MAEDVNNNEERRKKLGRNKVTWQRNRKFNESHFLGQQDQKV